MNLRGIISIGILFGFQLFLDQHFCQAKSRFSTIKSKTLKILDNIRKPKQEELNNIARTTSVSDLIASTSDTFLKTGTMGLKKKRIKNLKLKHLSSKSSYLLFQNLNSSKSNTTHSNTTKKIIGNEHGSDLSETEHFEYDCKDLHMQGRFGKMISESFCYSPSDSLKCYQDPIFCEMYHLSGKRELKWPAYGEYSYLSHENWVKVLQHGGVVFLYHPCANESTVALLRDLAMSCMNRYVLTPCAKLSQEKPLALVSWGCFLLMNKVNLTESKLWIRSHAYHGPASHVHKNGTYEKNLVRASRLVTDVKDTFLCPNEEEKASLRTSVAPVARRKTVIHTHMGEELLLKRLAKAKHKVSLHDPKAKQLPVDTKRALSAFASLVFICVSLILLLLYTKLWKPKLGNNSFKYDRLHDDDVDLEYKNDYENFSLLKSGQDFISSLRRGKRERNMDFNCKVKLLTPITEEDDNFSN